MASVDIIINTIDKGSQGAVSFARSFGNAWKDVATPLNQTLELLGKVKQFGQDAFEFFERGATVNQVTESFDRMNESIWQTPQLLEDMTAAAKGTISDFDAMSGLLTLTAGASDEMSKQFAEAAPRLLEIAKAAQKLNPTIGDVSTAYADLSAGIKRGSALVIDNLGISVSAGEANEQYAASVGKAAKELTKEEQVMALLNLTMERGGKIIEQVGGTVDSQTDAYARLGVIAQETGDQIKSGFAEAIAPYLDDITESAEEMAPAFAEAAASAIPAIIGMAEALPDFVAGLLQAAEYAADVKEALDWLSSNRPGFYASEGRIEKDKQSLEELKEFLPVLKEDFLALKGVLDRDFGGLFGIEYSETTKGVEDHSVAMADLTDAYKNFTGPQKEVKAALDEELAAADETAVSMDYLYRVSQDVASAGELVNITSEDVAEALIRQEDAAKAAEQALIDQAEAMRELSAASGDYFTKALEGESFFKDAQFAGVGGRTAKQNEDLDELQRLYDRAADTISDYQSGIKGLGQDEEQVAEAIAKSAEAMDYYAGKMEGLKNIQGEYIQVAEAGINTDAINSELYAQADAAGASAEVLAMLKLATGELSDEQAIAALQTAAITARIKEMGDALASEEISAGDALANIQEFIAGLNEEDWAIKIHPEFAEGDAMDIGDIAEKVSKDFGKVFGDEFDRNMETFFGAEETPGGEVKVSVIPELDLEVFGDEFDRNIPIGADTTEAADDVEMFFRDIMEPAFEDPYVTEVQANIDTAMGQVDTFIQKLSEIPRSIPVVLEVTRHEQTIKSSAEDEWRGGIEETGG